MKTITLKDVQDRQAMAKMFHTIAFALENDHADVARISLDARSEKEDFHDMKNVTVSISPLLTVEVALDMEGVEMVLKKEETA